MFSKRKSARRTDTQSREWHADRDRRAVIGDIVDECCQVASAYAVR